MLEQKVDIFIMAGKRKQLSNDIKNVIVEMRKSGYRMPPSWILPVNYGTAL
jgi:hypothetical protein